MTDEDVRREAGNDEERAGYDPIVRAMRDMPRLRAVERPADEKEYLPPPPMVSRIGGMAQGCGSVLLTITAVMMLLTALWFGYYLWGPGLLLAGGLLLVGGTVGVWRGRRVPVVVSIVSLVVLAIVTYFWHTFVPAAGALSPLGGIGVFLGPLSLFVVLILGSALVMHVISLFYWPRLAAAQSRAMMVWGVIAVVLVGLALAFHFGQQKQRETWLEERIDTWSTEAAIDSLALGQTMNVTLGYSFVTADEDDDDRLDVRLAELDAALDAGASVIRLTASGDMRLEAGDPRIFKLDEDQDPAEERAEAAARVERQRAVEAQFMQRVVDSGAKLILSDSQYSPYLLVLASDEEKITWEAFTKVQEERVRYYAGLYQPYAYEIVTEPGAYEQYSGLDAIDEDEKLDLWVAQTEELAAAVREESPDTRIGVTVSLSEGFDLDYYERVLAIEGVDFIGVRLFSPAAFEALEDLLAERGRPSDAGKELWVLETWYGYCLAPQRSMDLDATWLETVMTFAAKEGIPTVLVNDYGCFLQEGGTLFQSAVDLDGRTDVWNQWHALVEAWQRGS